MDSQSASLRTAIRTAFAKNKHIQTHSPLAPARAEEPSESTYGPTRNRRRSIDAACDETWNATFGPYSTNSTPLASPTTSMHMAPGELLSAAMHAQHNSSHQQRSFSDLTGQTRSGATSLIRLDSLGKDQVMSFKEKQLEERLAFLESENEMLRRKLDNRSHGSDTSPANTSGSSSTYLDVSSPASRYCLVCMWLVW